MAYGKKISVSLCLLVVFVGLVNGSKKEHKHHHVEKKPKQPHVDNQPQQPHDIEVKPKKEQVGIKPTNENVGFYELRTSNLYVKLTNWGASIATLSAPDKNGIWADIALGYDSVQEYMRNDKTYLGAIIGRVANRISGARFFLNGNWHYLVANDGQNTRHGGPKGFGDVAWKVSKHYKTDDSQTIVFTYNSHDGEQGFPGDLHATVTYTLLKNSSLSVKMTAKALNKPTPVNLAQHTYWNLGGHNSGNILSSEVQIFGTNFVALYPNLIPRGTTATVKGTPYDFLKTETLYNRINKFPHGYDIYYVLDGDNGKHNLKRAAIVHDKKSGRVMELTTDAPILEFDTGKKLKDVRGKGGYVYQPLAGFSLVTQGYPDAVNHPNFPSQIVTPDKPYKHHMLFKFSTKA